MIVSEDEVIVQSLKIILKNYIVENVSTNEIIKKINERRPFLIFLDTYLKEADPCQLIDKILKEDNKILIVPLVYSYDKNVKEIFEKNIFEIIEKPFLFEKIFFVLDKAEKWIGLNIEKEDVERKGRIEISKDITDEKKMNYFRCFFNVLLKIS